MDGAATAALGAWEAVRGFFTPATLFLTVNLVIGTILLTSRSHQRRRQGGHDADDARRHDHHQQEQQRFQHVEPQQQQHQEDLYYRDQQQQQQQYVPPPPAPAPLARTSSVLDRLRSIGLYRFRSGDFPPEYGAGADSRDVTVSPEPAPTVGDAHHARSRSEPPAREEARRAPPSRMKRSSSEARRAEVTPAPAARVVQAAVLEEDDDDLVEHARADNEFIDSNSFATPPPQQAEEEEQHYREEYVPPYRPAPLARAPSVLERLRSFSLYRFRSGDLAPELAASQDHAVSAVAAADEKKTQTTQYGRSRSEPAREQTKKGKKPAAKMSKSSTEARMLPPPPPPPMEEAVEEGGVDARADDFINSFRKQLQLQRLNSLLNYKEMLNRGA